MDGLFRQSVGQSGQSTPASCVRKRISWNVSPYLESRSITGIEYFFAVEELRSNGEHVKQCLSRVLADAVPCVQDRFLAHCRRARRSTLLRVAQHESIAVRLEAANGVLQRLPFLRGRPCLVDLDRGAAEAEHRALETGGGPRRGFHEDASKVLALQKWRDRRAGFNHELEVIGKPEQNFERLAVELLSTQYVLACPVFGCLVVWEGHVDETGHGGWESKLHETLVVMQVSQAVEVVTHYFTFPGCR
jgi:hypothetical protein